MDSSVVYQGVLKNRPAQWVIEWHEKAGIHLMPDVTFIFQDPPLVTAARRRQDAVTEGDRFDRLPIHSYEKIPSGLSRYCSVQS